MKIKPTYSDATCDLMPDLPFSSRWDRCSAALCKAGPKTNKSTTVFPHVLLASHLTGSLHFFLGCSFLVLHTDTLKADPTFSYPSPSRTSTCSCSPTSQGTSWRGGGARPAYALFLEYAFSRKRMCPEAAQVPHRTAQVSILPSSPPLVALSPKPLSSLAFW